MILIKELNVATKHGTVLNGTLFKTTNAQTVLIAITGVHGNFYSNPFYVNIGKTLSEAGVDFIYAQTRDAFGQMESINRHTGQKEIIGSWSENFNDADGDIQAYLDYADDHHYQHIILAGHSLGANKVIHFLAGHPHINIDKFLLISPANLKRLTDTVSPAERQLVHQLVNNNQGSQILPFQLFGWIPCTADTAYQWLETTTLDNVHSEQDGDFSQIRHIQHDGALVIGTLDSFTYGDPKKYLQNINNHFRHPERNQLIFIQGTGHTFQQKEQELADHILQLMNLWKIGGKNNAIHHC